MEHLTGEQAAELLGISRSTLYRWVESGRLPLAWIHETLTPYIGIPKLPKGPPRRRWSVRYTTGRHSFYEVRRTRAANGRTVGGA